MEEDTEPGMVATQRLRHQMTRKSSEINELQVQWPRNEDKRRKRMYGETAPRVADSIAQEKKTQRTSSKLKPWKPTRRRRKRWRLPQQGLPGRRQEKSKTTLPSKG